MNAWLIYTLCMFTVIISRISVYNTSVLGAFFSVALVILGLKLTDSQIKKKAKFFEPFIFSMALVSFAIIGMGHVATNTAEESLSIFIHMCVTMLILAVVYETNRKEKLID